METIWLQRSNLDIPWGFRLQGGSDFNIPMAVQRITPGSVASHGLSPGDVILKIGNVNASKLSHVEGQELIRKATNILQLTIKKGGSVPIPTSSPFTPVASDPFIFKIDPNNQAQDYQAPTFQVTQTRAPSSQHQYVDPYTNSPAPPSYDSVYRDAPQQRSVPQPRQAPFSPPSQRYGGQSVPLSVAEPVSRGYQQSPFSPGSSQGYQDPSYNYYDKDPWSIVYGESPTKVTPDYGMQRRDFQSPQNPQINNTYDRFDDYNRQASFGRQNSQGRQDPYGRQDSQGMQDAYGRQNSQGRPDAYGRQNSQGRQDPYGRQDSYGRPEPERYVRHDNYGAVDNYGQDSYGRQNSLGRQQSFGSPPNRYNQPEATDYSGYSNTIPRRYGQPPTQNDVIGRPMYDNRQFSPAEQPLATSTATFSPSAPSMGYNDTYNAPTGYDDTVYRPFAAGSQPVSRPFGTSNQSVSQPISARSQFVSEPNSTRSQFVSEPFSSRSQPFFTSNQSVSPPFSTSNQPVSRPFTDDQPVSRPFGDGYQPPTSAARPFSQDNAPQVSTVFEESPYQSQAQLQPSQPDPARSSPVITVEPPPQELYPQPPSIPEEEAPVVPPPPAAPAPPPPPPPPPAPPPPPIGAGPAPGAWRQKRESQEAISSDRNGVDSGNKGGGPGKIPDGLISAMNKPGQKPFSYLGGVDLKQQLQGMKERRRQAVQEAARAKASPAVVVPEPPPKLHAAVSARPAPATITSAKSTMSPPIRSGAPDFGHSQMQERQQKDESEVAKCIRESESGGQKLSPASAGDESDFRGGSNKQSMSFRMLQWMTDTDQSPEDTDPQRKRREKDPELRHNSEDDEMRFTGLNRGTDIPSKSFNRLQKLTVEEEEANKGARQYLNPNATGNEDGEVGKYDETSIRYKGKYIPSPAFRVLQNWAELDPMEVSPDKSEKVPDRRDRDNEDVQRQDDVPLERRYKGSNIPSRVFRTLQMAVGEEGSDQEGKAPATSQASSENHGPRSIRVIQKPAQTTGSTDF